MLAMAPYSSLRRPLLSLQTDRQPAFSVQPAYGAPIRLESVGILLFVPGFARSSIKSYMRGRTGPGLPTAAEIRCLKLPYTDLCIIRRSFS